jgi:hypothetical protein
MNSSLCVVCTLEVLDDHSAVVLDDVDQLVDSGISVYSAKGGGVRVTSGRHVIVCA